MKPLLFFATVAAGLVSYAVHSKPTNNNPLVTKAAKWNLPSAPFCHSCHRNQEQSLRSFVAQFPRGGQRGSNTYDYDSYADEGYQDNGSYYSSRRPDYGNDPNRDGRTYDDDYFDDYDDRGRFSSQRGDEASSSPSGLSSMSMPNIIKKGDRKIGTLLLGAGLAITMLGISLFFNKALMRFGNLLFIAGVPVTIGPGRTAGYFFQPQKSRATACLAVGIFLVFVGYPLLGILLEGFGLLNLFGNMFPVVMVILKQMPVIGPMLGKNKSPAPSSRREDRYGDDDYDDYYNDRDGKYDDRDDPYTSRYY